MIFTRVSMRRFAPIVILCIKKKILFVLSKVGYLPKELDLEKMNEAANYLIGRQDFTSLSKLHTDVKTNMCDVSVARWIRMDDSSLYFEISADRFLRNMVRATVGTLIDVGLGKFSPKDVVAILAAKDRQAASISVPAHGLFLWEVKY